MTDIIVTWRGTFTPKAQAGLERDLKKSIRNFFKFSNIGIVRIVGLSVKRGSDPQNVVKCMQTSTPSLIEENQVHVHIHVKGKNQGVVALLSLDKLSREKATEIITNPPKKNGAKDNDADLPKIPDHVHCDPEEEVVDDIPVSYNEQEHFSPVSNSTRAMLEEDPDDHDVVIKNPSTSGVRKSVSTKPVPKRQKPFEPAQIIELQSILRLFVSYADQASPGVLEISSEKMKFVYGKIWKDVPDIRQRLRYLYRWELPMFAEKQEGTTNWLLDKRLVDRFLELDAVHSVQIINSDIKLMDRGISPEVTPPVRSLDICSKLDLRTKHEHLIKECTELIGVLKEKQIELQQVHKDLLLREKYAQKARKVSQKLIRNEIDAQEELVSTVSAMLSEDLET